MQKLKLIVCLLGVLSFCGGGVIAQQSADIPIKRIVLYSSGVGYFEHGGNVSGNSKTELSFKTDQINDILKSLVLQDFDGGKIGTVVYPSRDPLTKILRSFEIDLSPNPNLHEVMQQLRGASVRIIAGAETVEGQILGVEKRPKALSDDAPPVDVSVVNIVTPSGIRSIYFDESLSFEVLDEKLKNELNRALTALGQSRDQERKPITLEFLGEGQRRVRFGYLVETPVWKTSYRLVLPATGEEKGYLQGWAIVENQTDADWSDVQLSLVSGRPISFIQDLYQPLYTQRPVVETELYKSLSPKRYTAGVEEKSVDKLSMGRGVSAERRKAAPSQRMELEAGPALASAADSAAPAAPMEEMAAGKDMGMGGYNYAFDMDTRGYGVQSMATTGQVGDLFQYTVGSVSLPRQRSAMLPIITAPIEVKRLSIYNEATLMENPLLGARITNDSGNHLLQGPVTVFEQDAYAGDAQWENFPPDQQRLISYAVDLQVRILSKPETSETKMVSARIERGILQLSQKRISHKEYVIANKGDVNRTVLIEHPFKQEWKLVNTPEPVEKTETLYRFESEVVADSTTSLVVNEEWIDRQVIALLPADFGVFEFYTQNGEISESVRKALTKGMELKRAIEETNRDIENRTQQIREITAEQERIRENLKTIQSQQNQYYTRLMKKLDDQESQLESLQSEITALREKLAQQQRALEDYLANLTIG